MSNTNWSKTLRMTIPKLIQKLVKFIVLLWGIVAVLSGFNMLNPMRIAFLGEFSIANQTAKPLWITPLGKHNSDSAHVALALYCCKIPAIPALRTARFRIESQETISLTYDTDNSILSDILVEDSRGNIYMLPAGLSRSQPPRNSSQFNQYEITDLSALEPANAAINASYSSKPSFSTFAIVVWPGFIVVAVWIGRWYFGFNHNAGRLFRRETT